MSTRKKLGQILLDAGAIDEYQLKSALGFQKKWGGLLGHVLVENRFITEEALVDAIHKQTGIAVVQMTGRIIPEYLTKLVPQDLAEKYHLIPIGIEGEAGKPTETVLVAISDPTNLNALDELRFRTGKRVRPVLAGDKAIEAAIATHYRGEASGGLDFDLDPEAIQFGGQQVAVNDLKNEELLVVTGKLESAQTASALPPAGDDPFAELDALGSDPTPAATDEPKHHPAATALDFDLDVADAPAAGDDGEVLEDLEIIEEFEPFEADAPPAPIRGAPPPPADRDLSLFGEAMESLPGDLDTLVEAGETVSNLDSMPEPLAEPPDLDQPADLTSVPDLDPPPRAPPELAGEPVGVFEFGDGDDLDLDSVLEPLSGPSGAPPPPEPDAADPARDQAPVRPAGAAKPLQSDAMKALLSRVGLGKQKPVSPETGAGPQPEPAVEPQPEPVIEPQPELATTELAPTERSELDQPEPEPVDAELFGAGRSGQDLVQAIVRLLVRKGLISEAELQSELERD